MEILEERTAAFQLEHSEPPSEVQYRIHWVGMNRSVAGEIRKDTKGIISESRNK